MLLLVGFGALVKKIAFGPSLFRLVEALGCVEKGLG
jgi:hypothetical protein